MVSRAEIRPKQVDRLTRMGIPTLLYLGGEFISILIYARGMTRHRRSYAQVVSSPDLADALCSQNNDLDAKNSPSNLIGLPWSQNGILIGVRHFGELCLPNPTKTVMVKRVPSCNSLIEEEEGEVIVKSPEAVPGSCCIM